MSSYNRAFYSPSQSEQVPATPAHDTELIQWSYDSEKWESWPRVLEKMENQSSSLKVFNSTMASDSSTVCVLKVSPVCGPVVRCLVSAFTHTLLLSGILCADGVVSVAFSAHCVSVHERGLDTASRLCAVHSWYLWRWVEFSCGPGLTCVFEAVLRKRYVVSPGTGRQWYNHENRRFLHCQI